MPRSHHRNHLSSQSDALLDAWRRRKWIAIVVFVMAFSGVVAVARSLPDLYQAATTVLVERQEVSETLVKPMVTAELETRIQTIREQVMSRTRLKELIIQLDPYPHLRGKASVDDLADRMRRDVRLDLKGVEQAIGRGPTTIAFTLSYSGRDPQMVAKVANALSAAYVQENTTSREGQASRTTQFLKAQLDEIKHELDAQEGRATQFKLQHTNELPQQVEANLGALDRLNTQLRLNGEYQIRAMERHERLEQQLAEAAVTWPKAPPTDTPAAQLLKLELKLAELRTQFSDQYPDVIRTKAEIADLTRQVKEAGVGARLPTDAKDDPTRRLEVALRQVEGEVVALKKEEAFLRQVIPGYEARVENAPKRQDELQQLSSDHEITRERYETLSKRYEEAQLAESLEQGKKVEQFQILDPALPPTSPAAPNRVTLLLMGLIASLVLAFGTVVAIEKLDSSFHTVDDLRAFAAAPTLGTISLIATKTDTRRYRLRFALTTVVSIVALILIVTASNYIAVGNEQIVRRLAGGLR